MRRATSASAGLGLRASTNSSFGLLCRGRPSALGSAALISKRNEQFASRRLYSSTADEFVNKLMVDLKEATMAKDKVRLGVIRRLRSEIMNKEKLNVDAKLEYGDCVKVVQQMAKQCEDNAKEYDSINPDTAAKEREEARLLRVYLPAQLSEAEVQKLAEEAVKAVGATTIKDMKNVMAHLSPLVQGKADPAQVGEAVRKLLGAAK